MSESDYRNISVSMEVFSKIWKAWKKGDTDESSILSRVLDNYLNEDAINEKSVGGDDAQACPFGNEKVDGIDQPLVYTDVNPQKNEGGFFDQRNQVRFPEGFKAFRVYKGRRYEWEVRGGKLVMDGMHFDSINQLTMSFLSGFNRKSENAWMNWFYKDKFGVQRPIDSLRRKEVIMRRPGSSL